VVLASSADPQEFTVLRAVLDAEDAIDEATSASDVDQSKPAPDLVQVALGKAGVAPERAVFVGDTVWDVQACQSAGVPCIGLRSGGISTAELRPATHAARRQAPSGILKPAPENVRRQSRPALRGRRRFRKEPSSPSVR
jgi:phosphoglycolate phosphatase-like HAD superfamily hydrolase